MFAASVRGDFVLRIHFTDGDLERVRVLDAPSPLWEVPLSLRLLHGGAGASVFGRWRTRTRTELGKSTDPLRYFELALRPHWHMVRAHVRAESRSRTGSAERLLATLHADVRWERPVLEVISPIDEELHLDKRGLALAPSFFCWGTPVLFRDLAVLAYPIDHDPAWANTEVPPTTRSLANLLGRTRAAVLNTICAHPDVTTTELARRLGISAAGASQHTSVLRDSGLITTHRLGGAAFHALAPRGSALLCEGV